MTAYAVPPNFAHGDKPTAANLNKIADGSLHVYERTPDFAWEDLTPELGNGERMSFQHFRRYLHYKSSGQVIDPAGLGDTVSLPNTTDDYKNSYDLDQISWLAYGADYIVQGVSYAAERSAP